MMICCFERHAQHLFRMLCSDCVRSRASWKPGCFHRLLNHDCRITCLNLKPTEHQLFEIEHRNHVHGLRINMLPWNENIRKCVQSFIIEGLMFRETRCNISFGCCAVTVFGHVSIRNRCACMSCWNMIVVCSM